MIGFFNMVIDALSYVLSSKIAEIMAEKPFISDQPNIAEQLPADQPNIDEQLPADQPNIDEQLPTDQLLYQEGESRSGGFPILFTETTVTEDLTVITHVREISLDT